VRCGRMMRLSVRYSVPGFSLEKLALIVQGVAQNGVAKARSLERETPVYPLGPSKEARTRMHRASLRVIIPVPEVGDANKSEGGAIVSVWIHTNGWSINLEAPEMRRGGGRSFRSRRFGRALSPGGGLRSQRLPILRCLSSCPRILFSSGRNPVSEDPARKLVRDGLSA
jgi:hypothetical protein